MSNISIRRSETTDIERNFEIWYAGQIYSTGIANYDIKQLKIEFTTLFTHPESVVSVAVDEDGIIVGWQGIFAQQANPLLSKYTAQICTYLDTTSAPKDLAKVLTNHTIGLAKQKGIEHIYGWVKSDNHPANALSRKFAAHEVAIMAPRKGNLPDFNIYVIDVSTY